MWIRGSLTCRIALLTFAALVVAACSPASRLAAATPVVQVDVAFTCLWWSDAQMEGLNPNAPPPKNTEVTIKKWEYSDPVGVPHPETVDIVVTLVNTSGEILSNLEVEVSGAWKDGPLHSPARAVWSQPTVLKKFDGVSVGPSEPRTLRVPVEIKSRMDPLYKRGQWPFGFRTTVAVRRQGSTEPLARAVTDLPIIAGD